MCFSGQNLFSQVSGSQAHTAGGLEERAGGAGQEAVLGPPWCGFNTAWAGVRFGEQETQILTLQ